MTVTPEENEKAAGLFRPLYNRFDYSEKLKAEKPLLAHYTSIQALELILRDQEIWFSNPLFMNDLEEIRFGIYEGRIIFSQLKKLAEAAGSGERLQLLQAAFDHYFKMLEEEGAFDIYVFCLSEHDRNDNDGSLPMWRAYGSQGSGAAIVFDTSMLNMEEPSPIAIAKVKYATQEERRQELAALLDEWCEILKKSNLPDKLLYVAAYTAIQAIKLYALTSKHKGFSEECEWRIIYLPEMDTENILKDSLSYFIGSRGVEPKLKLKVIPAEGKSFPKRQLVSLINRVVLGPSHSSMLAKKSFVRMLEGIDRSELAERVFSSSIPLRSQ
jgi:hypothetical protein